MARAMQLLTMLAAVVAAPALVLGDGCFWPPPAFPKMPEIPAQRAMLVHRDGVETLIVESAVKSESPDVAWILPLPAEPTEIAPADPGVLTTLWFCTRPHIVDEKYGPAIPRLLVILVPLALALPVWVRARAIGGRFGAAGWCFIAFILAAVVIAGSLTDMDTWDGALDFLILPVALTVIVAAALTISEARARGRDERQPRVASMVIALLAAFLLTIMLLSAMAHSGVDMSLDVPGVSVVQEHQVGSYQVKVVRAQAPGALSEWLVAGGFQPLGERAEQAVADYISEGWCFAVAALRVVGGEPSKPHPLRVRFPAEQPIYPMRLTALAGTAVDLELYVVAKARARHPLMATALADRYAPGPGRWASLYQGEVSDGIGLPDICDLMWPGCVLTRLEAALAPAQMQEDLTVQVPGGPLSRRTLYSTKAARERAACYGILALLGAAVVIILQNVIAPGRRRSVLVAALLIPASLAVAAATYLLSPTTEIATTRASRFWADVRARNLEMYLALLEEDGRIEPDMNDEETAEAVLSALESEEIAAQDLAENPFFGGRSRAEKSPGNVWIEHHDGRRWFTLYGIDGTPSRIKLFSGPEPGGER